MLTVGQLIAQLQKYPQDLPVIATQERGFDFEIRQVARTFECLEQLDEVTIYIVPVP